MALMLVMEVSFRLTIIYKNQFKLVINLLIVALLAMLPAIVVPFLIVIVNGYFLKDLNLVKSVLPFLIGAVSEENGLGYF
jgi:hypothetical protein